MKLLTILGARPQFIKAAALSREIKNHDDISETILHTGQHFDENMSDIFFKEMDIPAPKYQLTVNSLSHAAMTGQMMTEIDTIINIENPRAVSYMATQIQHWQVQLQLQNWTFQLFILKQDYEVST
jgi:UDP-GlcNAc3NAcA epimerase